MTQRLTKYPVLMQRILDNTKGNPRPVGPRAEATPPPHPPDLLLSPPLHPGNEEEAQTLTRALSLLKELISSVDKEVLELDRTRRLQEIQARLDPRAQAEVRGGGAFRAGELLRRKLLHEGALLWKVQGSRMKGTRRRWLCGRS